MFYVSKWTPRSSVTGTTAIDVRAHQRKSDNLDRCGTSRRELFDGPPSMNHYLCGLENICIWFLSLEEALQGGPGTRQLAPANSVRRVTNVGVPQATIVPFLIIENDVDTDQTIGLVIGED
jgi:hypothetical protein